MSAEEYIPPKSLQDILLWESELPSELSGEVDPLDLLLRTEFDEVDQNFERLCEQVKRLNMLPTASVVHSFWTRDGSVLVSSNRVPTSENYAWERCLNITINYRQNDLFSAKPQRHLNIEDYFVDLERNLISIAHGNVTLGDTWKLPPGTPSVIWKNVSGIYQLFRGEGYTLVAPDYQKSLDYDEARQLRQASGKLMALLSGLGESTRE